jgi:hypothetical protein
VLRFSPLELCDNLNRVARLHVGTLRLTLTHSQFLIEKVSLGRSSVLILTLLLNLNLRG